MATVTTIAGLIKTELDALAGVDQSSITAYLPPIKTESVALIIPAFGQQTQLITPTSGRGLRIKWHRIRCEFWVKLNAGNPDNAVALAREIGLQAIEALLISSALNNESYRIGYYGEGTTQTIESDVADGPITIGGVDYIITTVYVPIVDYSD